MSLSRLALTLLILSGCAMVDTESSELDSDVALSADVCACETPDCLEDIVRETYGCDICVTWECETGTVHSCAMCDGEDPNAPLGSALFQSPNASELAPLRE